MNLNEHKKDVFNRVELLIDKHGPRLAGSKACLDTSDDLYEEMKGIADEAKQESFFVYQGAFLGWIKILVLSYLAAVILLWLNLPLYAFIIAFISQLILVLQFFLYLPLLDKFYPKKQAKNVYGILEPTDEVKQQIIISGHHDSAHVFNFFIHQPNLYNLRTTGSIGLVIFITIIAALQFLFNIPSVISLILNVGAAIGFLLVGQMWFFTSKKVAPGAGDNLAATSIAWTLGKHFKALRDQGMGLKHTRLILMSFDAEEEGLRGARAYAKTHQDEFKNLKTYMLNMDCLYDEKELFFLTSDLNDFVKLDTQLANDLVDVASSLGIQTKTQPLAFLTGGTDAAELAKKGVSATTLIGMPWTNSSRSNVYHTPNDTLDKISEKVIENTMEIYIKYIENR
jgi:hypothetical protein